MKNLQKTLDIIMYHLPSIPDDMYIFDIAETLEPYSEKLIELHELFKNADKGLVKTTILHDYNGLKSKDEDFCPRLS